MKRSLFLSISAAVATLFGIGFLLFPDKSAANFGMSTIPDVLSFARANGALLIGIGIINALARNESLTASLKAILWGNLVIHIVTLVTSYVDIAAGTVNSAGWVGVIVHALFAAGFAYFLFVSKEIK